MKTIQISDQGAALIDKLIATGACASASQAIDLSLQLLDENLAQLRNDVSLGMNDVRAGRVAPLDIEGIKMRARQIHEGQAVGD